MINSRRKSDIIFNWFQRDFTVLLVSLFVVAPFGYFSQFFGIEEIQVFSSNLFLLPFLFLLIVLQLLQSPRFKYLWPIVLSCLCLVSFLILIEIGHVLAGKNPLLGLDFIRMIVYSKFYGKITVYVLFSIFLLCLGKKGLIRIFEVSLILTIALTFIFLIIWCGVFFDLFRPPPRVQVLHNNSFGYQALISLYFLNSVGLRFVSKKVHHAMSVVLIGAILVVQSRGVFICTIFLLGYLFLFENGITVGRVSWRLKLIACVCVSILAYETSYLALLRLSPSEIYSVMVGGYQSAFLGHFDFFQLEVLSTRPGAASSFSRLGTLAAMFGFLATDWLFGVGQSEVYSLAIAGSSIHSFYPLVMGAAGFIGLGIVLAFFLVMFAATNFSSWNTHLGVLIVCFLVMPLFLNHLQNYTAYCFFLVLLADAHKAKNN